MKTIQAILTLALISLLGSVRLNAGVTTNLCPHATNMNVAVNQNSSTNFQLQASDPDGDPLTYNVTQAPAHGIVVVQPMTGPASYPPNSGYCGPHSFRFTVIDGQCLSAPATVSITILCSSNRPPVCDLQVPCNGYVIALNGSNACVVLDGSGSSDPDGDALAYSRVLSSVFNV